MAQQRYAAVATSPLGATVAITNTAPGRARADRTAGRSGKPDGEFRLRSRHGSDARQRRRPSHRHQRMQASLKNRISASPIGAPDPTRAETRRQRSGAASGDGAAAAAPAPACGEPVVLASCLRGGVPSGALLAGGELGSDRRAAVDAGGGTAREGDATTGGGAAGAGGSGSAMTGAGADAGCRGSGGAAALWLGTGTGGAGGGGGATITDSAAGDGMAGTAASRAETSPGTAGAGGVGNSGVMTAATGAGAASGNGACASGSTNASTPPSAARPSSTAPARRSDATRRRLRCRPSVAGSRAGCHSTRGARCSAKRARVATPTQASPPGRRKAGCAGEGVVEQRRKERHLPCRQSQMDHRQVARENRREARRIQPAAHRVERVRRFKGQDVEHRHTARGVQQNRRRASPVATGGAGNPAGSPTPARVHPDRRPKNRLALQVAETRYGQPAAP